MLDWLLVLAAVFCAYQLMRSPRLLPSALWLAVVSALVSLMLYRIGAPEVAVIELSVGAGLVTVLFVFAFSIVGDDAEDADTIIPRPLVWGLVLLVSILLGWYILPIAGTSPQAGSLPFAHMLWEHRGLDVVAQVVLIFSGVMGLIGLMTETRESAEAKSRQAVIASILEPDEPPLNGLLPEGEVSGEHSLEEVHA